jgi:hypothetical protein
MPLYTASITVDQVIDALADFLAPFVSGAEVVRAQVNRVAMPPNPCVILTELLQSDLSVPATEYQPPVDPAPAIGTATIYGPSRIDMQMDFYGAQAGEFCKTVKTAFRSHWGFAHFPAGIKPLYTSDGIQAPLTTGEQQYESRWTLTASLQYNPVVTVPQEFADVLMPDQVAPVDIFEDL